MSDGAGGLVEQQIRFPVWIDAVSGGATPMCEALSQARTIAEQWIAEHKGGFPPTVLHLTDGESTDGDPTDVGHQVTSLATSDGNTLIFTCHVSSTKAAKIEYPSDPSTLPDNFARVLFNISSPLPAAFMRAASEIGVRVSEGSRGFVFNGDAASVVQFFEIGTRPANLR